MPAPDDTPAIPPAAHVAASADNTLPRPERGRDDRAAAGRAVEDSSAAVRVAHLLTATLAAATERVRTTQPPRLPVPLWNP